MHLDTPWTWIAVGEALVGAYKLLDGAPVMHSGGGFAIDGEKVGPRSPAAWVGMRHYVVNAQDLRYLRVWASCVAQGERVAPRFRALGWHPVTAERHRRAALAAIAAGLNAEREMMAIAEA